MVEDTRLVAAEEKIKVLEEQIQSLLGTKRYRKQRVTEETDYIKELQRCLFGRGWVKLSDLKAQLNWNVTPPVVLKRLNYAVELGVVETRRSDNNWTLEVKVKQ